MCSMCGLPVGLAASSMLPDSRWAVVHYHAILADALGPLDVVYIFTSCDGLRRVLHVALPLGPQQHVAHGMLSLLARGAA
jgi:hypothetical protein